MDLLEPLVPAGSELGPWGGSDIVSLVAFLFADTTILGRTITTIARFVYNEPYSALPTSRRIDLDPDAGGNVEYGWIHGSGPHAFRAQVAGQPSELEPERWRKLLESQVPRDSPLR